jgi:Fe-S cluster assembly protein SufB
VVPPGDNFYAALNSAVFSDGSFVYIPAGVRCPMELSSYFRINARNTGQFERTLIIAEAGSHVSYLEGCTAPQRDEHQLHAAVVELIAHDDADIKYSTVQNWYPGDEQGRGGIYNFVTKRGLCAGAALAHRLDADRDRLGHHLEVPERGAARRRFARRVPFDRGVEPLPAGRHRHQDDPSGPQHQSRIVSKGISAGHAHNSYRGLVRVAPTAAGARNHTQCDSLLIGARLRRPHLPDPRRRARRRRGRARGHHHPHLRRAALLLPAARHRPQEATALIVGGFCQAVLEELPMEFALEAKALLAVSLEGAVG